MRSEISKLHAQLGNTMIYVTHDQVEAMTMGGSHLCHARWPYYAGRRSADSLPAARKSFVAGFNGSPPMNLLKGKVQRRGDGLFFVQADEKSALTFPLKGRLEPLANKCIDKNIVFGIRPEHITNEPKEGSSVPIPLTVDIAEPMGSESPNYTPGDGCRAWVIKTPRNDRCPRWTLS
jgi:multiple sugar transport system ATP-binding protein